MLSFFKKAASIFTKMFGQAPTLLQKMATAISYVAPLTNEIVALSAGEANAQIVTNIVHEVQSDLTTAATVISAAHGGTLTPTAATTIQGSLAAVNDNLKGLLVAGHIKNPDTQSKVSATVETITGELSAVLASFTQAVSPVAA